MVNAETRGALKVAIRKAILEMGIETFKTTSLFPLSALKAEAEQKLAA